MNKKKIAFVTDSTACLTEEMINHPDVYVVPIIVIANGEEYLDGVTLTSDELYEMIRTNKEVPKTSQPSAGAFEELYVDLKEKYEEIISVHVSNKLSGTVSSSTTGAELAECNVHVVDSLSISYGITSLIKKGIELAEGGASAEEIAGELREKVSVSSNLILLGDLDQLYKGGRMSGVQFLLGNALKIKPILTINDEGELVLSERVRSEKKATAKLVTLLKEAVEKNDVKEVGIMHGKVPERAAELKAMITSEIPALKTVEGEISSSIAVHAGEGTLAIFW